MSWNYRILKDSFSDYSGEFFDLYWIGEVYYDEDGNPRHYSFEVGAKGESIDELHEDLNRMKEALNKPYLEAW